MRVEDKERLIVRQFDDWSSDYDSGLWTWYFNSSVKLLTNKLCSVGNKKVLDIGCGTGELCIALASQENTKEVIGVDISPGMLNKAELKLEESNKKVREKVRFVTAPADKLPFDGSTFDVVTCLNSFHHHPNQEATIREISRVLKSGGRFYLLDPFLDNPIRKMWGSILKKIFNEPDVSYLTSSELKQLLINAGLEVGYQRTFYYFCLLTQSTKY